MSRIEALLSARLFLMPQLVGDRIFFISNLSGRMSLYAMDHGGSVPEPLIPPHIALQNPKLMQGASFVAFPDIGRILVMIDQDGNEAYQPHLIPIGGGFPEPIFADTLGAYNIMAFGSDLDTNRILFVGQSRAESKWASYLADLSAMTLTPISTGMYGNVPNAVNEAYDRYILADMFGAGDTVIYSYAFGDAERRLVYGTPLEQRQPGRPVAPSGIFGGEFIDDDTALLTSTILFDDRGGLARLNLDDGSVDPVTITGTVHTGSGELSDFSRLRPDGDRYTVSYNIDGCSWVYEGTFDPDTLTMTLDTVLVGRGELANGVLGAFRYDKRGDRYALSFSTATSPTQIYTIEGADRDTLIQHTAEKLLGLPQSRLAPGEDYPFTSHDGLRISARLYLPAAELGFEPPYPLVYYIHGGPTSQERPDFAWFSIPLIQQLTLRGFAVFVPNVRGSTGYGFEYMNHVNRDWGGQDRLDHVHAMTEVLAKDPRIDTTRAGVTGRSYGGYMTLTLAFRHPELWSAAVDMFGPYDLTKFAERVPATWKPFIKFSVGDPETEPEFFVERSPRTYSDQLACPMLVIQGKNDPRVWEIESRELVDELREQGKDVDIIVFENEGHDIIKYENRVICYNAIVDFFAEHLTATDEPTAAQPAAA